MVELCRRRFSNQPLGLTQVIVSQLRLHLVTQISQKTFAKILVQCLKHASNSRDHINWIYIPGHLLYDMAMRALEREQTVKERQAVRPPVIERLGCRFDTQGCCVPGSILRLFEAG